MDKQNEIIETGDPLGALNEAVEKVGGVGALAEAIGVGQSNVSNWRARGSVPTEHCAAIELATQGQVSRKRLRPDDWARIWPELTEAA